jgi:hypothetical protein
MTQKQKKAVSKPVKTAKVAANSKTSSAVSNAVPATTRPGRIEQVLSENDVRQRAYSLWEGRGRPIGTPEEDWHRAKEQLIPEKLG